MAVAKDCRYTQTHEWFRVAGKTVTIGITKFAADELTDITYVSLPEKGKRIDAGKSFGEVESVKATSDLYTAVGGVVVEINARLADHPELVNTDPLAQGALAGLVVTIVVSLGIFAFLMTRKNAPRT